MNRSLRDEMAPIEQKNVQREAENTGELTIMPAKHGGHVVILGAVYTLNRALPLVMFAGDIAACAAFVVNFYKEREPALTAPEKA